MPQVLYQTEHVSIARLSHVQLKQEIGKWQIPRSDAVAGPDDDGTAENNCT